MRTVNIVYQRHGDLHTAQLVDTVPTSKKLPRHFFLACTFFLCFAHGLWLLLSDNGRRELVWYRVECNVGHFFSSFSYTSVRAYIAIAPKGQLIHRQKYYWVFYKDVCPVCGYFFYFPSFLWPLLISRIWSTLTYFLKLRYRQTCAKWVVAQLRRKTDLIQGWAQCRTLFSSMSNTSVRVYNVITPKG